MHTPVLFLIFNRPDTTAEVFAAIRAARPPRLYVAADGARKGREGEAERCAEARRIASEVDWDCEVNILFRSENLGCRLAVSGAIDWFFEHEEEGIILEDDIVPLSSFFEYTETLLERYREDEQVMMISGCNFVSDRYQTTDSYFFSAYAHIWGWASWRRAWRQYDVAMADWPQVKHHNTIPANALISRKAWRRQWYSIFDAVHAGGINSWAYQWTYTLFRFGGLAVTPCTNLISNIGFGADSTHTSDDPPPYIRNAVLADLSFPLQHPDIVARNIKADKLEDMHVLGLAMRYRFISAIATLPLGKETLLQMQKAKLIIEKVSRISSRRIKRARQH